MEWTSACQAGAYHTHLECQREPIRKPHLDIYLAWNSTVNFLGVS